MDALANFQVIIRYIWDIPEHAVPFFFCHSAKSFAGKVFHLETVKSIVVHDRNGKVWLYLFAGHPEKTVNVPSKEAGILQ